MIDNYSVYEVFLNHLRLLTKRSHPFSPETFQRVAVIDTDYLGYAILFDVDLSATCTYLNNQLKIGYATKEAIRKYFPSSLRSIFSKIYLLPENAVFGPDHIWYPFRYAFEKNEFEFEEFTVADNKLATVYLDYFDHGSLMRCLKGEIYD